MEYAYISVDVETSGAVPGIYNLLSIGACLVGDREKQFYRELQPINSHFDIEAMRVGCLGLQCLASFKANPMYNPLDRRFSPSSVLGLLEEKGTFPLTAMRDFGDWIQKVRRDKKPLLVTDVQPFDGSFINWYFAKFLPDRENPFGHKGLNIDVLYRGLRGDITARLSDLGLEDDRKTPHNALDDAVFQARLAEKVFELMKRV
ncbi:3'-5' exonuclease [Candidatus Woesearchaeota archaeon]|nr:3'-5' exonuclease [Candidatus Woesearchaeota archaeon]